MKDTVSSNIELLDYAKNKHRSGLREEACSIYNRILQQEPDNVEALRLRAVVYMETGELSNCEKILSRALTLSPDNAAIYNNLGSYYQAKKNNKKALVQFQKALELDPEFGAAANNLGNCLRTLGEHRDAIDAYKKALEINDLLPQTWNNLGNALSYFEQYKPAEGYFMKALELHPQYSEAWNNLGICYVNQDNKDSAMYAYNQAIQHDNEFSIAYNNKGNLYLSDNHFNKALDCFEQAIIADPKLASAWNGSGYAHRCLGNLDHAIKCFKKSIGLDSEYAEAWNNLGLTYADQGLLDSSLKAFQTALEIRPNYVRCHSNRLFYLNYLIDLHERTLFEAHEHWAVAHQKYPDEHSKTKPSKKGHSVLNIGFVSADFCRHPISYFLLPVLKTLSSTKFNIFAYSNNVREDDQTQKIKNYCSGWRRVSNLNDNELVSMIRDDRIDILFDLSGHTNGNRLTAFSLKPANIQISWLGYPHTTGLDAIDFFLTDKVSSPDYLRWMYTERLVHLPNSKYCYEAPEYTPAVNDLPALKNGFITFASFNNPVKFNSETYALWSEVLKQNENSILVLSWKTLGDKSVAKTIYNEFKKHSISQKRIKLLGNARSHEQVFKDYCRTDIALDTYPFTGGLTTCEAMWMGIPVVTMAGKKPASRQTASILSEVGLDELVGFSAKAIY